MKVLLARLAEPSSWAGLAGVLTTLGFNLPPGTVQAIVYILAGICGVAAFFIPEGK